ncbi:MAG: rubredoxin [Clostridia bacterium]
MAKYICSICGYVYDEQKEKMKFDDLPASWVCPLCGAPKSAFNREATKEIAQTVEPIKAENKTVEAENKAVKTETAGGDRALTYAELNVLCTNLAKGCLKQYRAEEAGQFQEIADFYSRNSEKSKLTNFDDISLRLDADVSKKYPTAFENARHDADRGALRILTWSEKVSKIEQSIIKRYKEEGASFLANTKIFVCEICGFIYIGDEAPEICPICKVPKFKINEVGRI